MIFSETSKVRIFRTVSPFWPPFEAIGSYWDVLSYEMGFGIIGRLNYVGSLKTHRFVNFDGVICVQLMCNRTMCFVM